MNSHHPNTRRRITGLAAGTILGIALTLVAAGGALATSANFFLGMDITGLEADLARYDQIVVSAGTVEELDAIALIRELNPEIRIFVLFDFMVAYPEGLNQLATDYAAGVKEDWRMQSTTGDYINFWPGSYQVNFTDVCPVIDGQVARDYISEFFGERILPYLGHYDGLYLDCCFENITWMTGHSGEIDLNMDGYGDETMDILNWVRDGWRDILDDFRLQRNDLLLVGNGSNHLFEHLNGRMLEDFPNSSYGYLTGGLSLLETWRYSTSCDFSIVNSIAEPEERTERRAGWALAALTDQKVCYDHGPYSHNEMQWDELFEVELGDPREDMHIEGFRRFHRSFEGGLFEDTVYSPVEWDLLYGGGHALFVADDPLEDKWSLRLTVPTEGWQVIYLADLLPNAYASPVMISFRYRVEEAGLDGVKFNCALRGHDGDGDEKVNFDQRILFPGEEGHFIANGSQSMQVRDDWYLYMTTTAPCVLVIDEIRITNQGGAYAERAFDNGILVHDLGHTGVVLDKFPDNYVPSSDAVFAGTWEYHEEFGISVLYPNETVVMVRDMDGFADGIAGDEDGGAEAAPREIFGAAYPNPFNPRVNIPFALERASDVRMEVFDVSGRSVALVADGTYSAGSHEIVWNAGDRKGRELPSGIYFIKLKTNEDIDVQKLVLAR